MIQWPQELPLLIRGCRAEHAIENGARLRLSKPEVFRYDGETLIGDPFEGVTQREERHVDLMSPSAIQTIWNRRNSETCRTQRALAAGHRI